MCGLDPTGSGKSLVSGCYKDVNEPLGSLKGKDFHGLLSHYQLLKNDFLPWRFLVSVLIGQATIHLLPVSDLY